jgi:putative transposase
MPSTISISKAMQLIKGGSSKWIHEEFPENRLFEWQKGYGAFSIGIGDIERTINYINNQAEHHGKMDFKVEFLAFLKKHEIEYDERFIFD